LGEILPFGHFKTKICTKIANVPDQLIFFTFFVNSPMLVKLFCFDLHFGINLPANISGHTGQTQPNKRKTPEHANCKAF
jgi:hypothetical protein